MERKARKTDDDEALLLFLPEQASPLAADPAPIPAGPTHEASASAEEAFSPEPARQPQQHDYDLRHQLDPWLDEPKWTAHPAPPFPQPPAKRRPAVLPWVLVGFALGALLWINRDLLQTIQSGTPRAFSLADAAHRPAPPLPEPEVAAGSSSTASVGSGGAVGSTGAVPSTGTEDSPGTAGSTASTGEAQAEAGSGEASGRPAPRLSDSRPAAAPPRRSQPPVSGRAAVPAPPSRESPRTSTPEPVLTGTTGAPATPAAATPDAAPRPADPIDAATQGSSIETARAAREAPPRGAPAPPAVAPSTARAAPAAVIPEVDGAEAAEAAVLDTVRRYEAAYDRLDARAAAAVWPAVDERALSRAFSGLESQGLTLDRCDVQIESVSATARCQGSISYVGRVGGSRRTMAPQEWTFRLRRAGSGWLIDEVVAAQTR